MEFGTSPVIACESFAVVSRNCCPTLLYLVTEKFAKIPFNRHFYAFKLPCELDEIDTELKGVTDRIVEMIGELSWWDWVTRRRGDRGEIRWNWMR